MTDCCSFIWATNLRKKLLCFVFRVKELTRKFFMDCVAIEEGRERFHGKKS